MSYSVCVIDDEIPFTGLPGMGAGDRLTASNLESLLGDANKKWKDGVVRTLVNTLVFDLDDSKKKKWEVFGFTNPAFFLNSLATSTVRTDIVIVDWDFPSNDMAGGIKDQIREILESTFCVVFVFSGADKEPEIRKMFGEQEFLEFQERLEYFDKSSHEGDQVDKLLAKAESMFSANFSFRFGNKLRVKAIQSIDTVLSEMGRASLNDIRNHIMMSDYGAKKDFIDFLTERFRAALAGEDLYKLTDEILASAGGAPVLDRELVIKLWSYRLYFNSSVGDDVVRRGDIVKIDQDYCIVLSADCDLNRFWKKNLGKINTVSLHEIKNSNTSLRDMLTICVKADQIPHPKDRKPSSLFDKIGDLAEGPFILPFVPVVGGRMDFMALPKDIETKTIPLPDKFSSLREKDRVEKAVEYDHWTGATKLCSVSEPFLTPLIQHVLSTIGGYGVPDYDAKMITILNEILRDFTNSGSVSA